jgi:HlyD family secretion protein
MPKHISQASPQPPGQTGTDRSPLLLIALLIVVIIVAIGLWLAFRKPADLVQGMVDADSINVAAKITARVEKLYVNEGDRVKPGQVLFELDSPEVSAKSQQAAAVLAAAQATATKAANGPRVEDVRVLEANWKRAQAGNNLAQVTSTRLNNLYREGVVTRQNRDEAQAQAISAAEQEKAARAQYDQARVGTRPEDKAAAAAQVSQAQGAVAEVQAAEDEVQGRAPAVGEVSKRLVTVGELVPAGYPVFAVTDIDHPWVAFNLREDQFSALKMGDHLSGNIPALGMDGAEFQVYFINPAGDFATWRATRQSSGYDVKSFEVRVRPVQPIQGLRPGMSVLFPWPPR